MKTKFVKTTLSLSLLLMAAAPTAAFAETNCNANVSVPSNQSMVKEINSCGLNGQSLNVLKNQSCLDFKSYFKFDGGKLQFVPNNNCQLQGDCENQKGDCENITCDNQNQGNNNSGSNGSSNSGNNGSNGGNNGSNNGNNGSNNGNNGSNSGNTNNGNINNGNTNSGGSNITEEANVSAYAKQVVGIVNQERAKAGLSPLTLNTKVSKVAQAKAEDMKNNNYFSHTSPTYGSPFDMMKQFGVSYSSAGENIAKGQKTPQSVMNAWMNSSGHKANIMSNSFEQIGVGYTTDSKGNTYWVQMFIK